MSWSIRVRDANRNFIGEVDDFDVLELVPRFNSVGAWKLTTGVEHFDDFTPEGGISGIVVLRDGETELSGPLTRRHLSFDGNKEVLEVSGLCDNCHLARRLTFPDSTGPIGTFTVARDTETDDAETVLHHYVNTNLGAGAKAARRLAGLTFATNQQRGTVIKAGPRLMNLLTFLQRKAVTDDLGFRIRQVGTNLQFEVYDPTDRTAEVIFAKGLGNVSTYEFEEAVPEATYVIAGGQGAGAARTFYERPHGHVAGGQDAIAKWGIIEEFIDRRDISDLTEGQQETDERLKEASVEPTAVQLTPSDTTAITYGRDYGLGDLVTARFAGIELQQIITEVTITLNGDGVSIRPTIGDPLVLAGTETRTQKKVWGVAGKIIEASARN